MPPRLSKTWGWILTKHICCGTGLTLHSLFLRTQSWCPGGCRSPELDSPGRGCPGQKSGRKQGLREWGSEKPGKEELNCSQYISPGNPPLPKTPWLSDCIWGTWLVFTSPEHYLSESFILVSFHALPLPAIMILERRKTELVTHWLYWLQAGNKVRSFYRRSYKISSVFTLEFFTYLAVIWMF